MPNVIQAARDQIASLTRTAFGLSGGTLMDVATAERVNWRKLMEQVEQDATASGITPPYGVLIFGPAKRADLALNALSRDMEIRALFVASLRDGASTKAAGEVREEIEDKLIALETAILADSSGTLQCWDTEIDLDALSPANQYYMDFNLPLYAGYLTSRIMVGKA
jgi:hypothetical protein